jgi:parvulin-like peptidyl-prolyl isomerase
MEGGAKRIFDTVEIQWYISRGSRDALSGSGCFCPARLSGGLFFARTRWESLTATGAYGNWRRSRKKARPHSGAFPTPYILTILAYSVPPAQRIPHAREAGEAPNVCKERYAQEFPTLSFISSRTAALTGAALGITLLGAGCGKQDTFARVNGQAISQDEYVRALERAVIQPPGMPTPVPAGRLVLDQVIGNKVVMAEASRLGVMPDDKAVDQRFELQKRIMKEQMPQSTFEEEMKKQGMTMEEVKDQFRAQMAETELVAKRLNLKEEDVKKAYETQKANLGMPERVHLRVIAVPAQGDTVKQVQQALASKTDFAEVAKTYNSSPQLKTSGGLLPQATPANQVPAPWRAKVNSTKSGEFFGPVDAPATPGAPPLKAWVKVENKLPAFQLSL